MRKKKKNFKVLVTDKNNGLSVSTRAERVPVLLSPLWDEHNVSDKDSLGGECV